MQPSSINPSHIQSLIEDFEGRHISQEKLEELYSLLRASPEAREIYWDYMTLSTLLQHEALNLQAQDKLLPLPGTNRKKQKKTMIRAFSLAAVAIVALAAIAHFIILPKHNLQASYTLSHGAQCTVSHASHSEDHSDEVILPGSKVNLKTGELTVKLPDFITLHAKAPASLHFITLHEIELHSGEVWANSSSKKEQLTILTDGYSIQDIGTKFGVIQRENEAPEVHLIEGAVKISHKNSDVITLDAPAAVSLLSPKRAHKITLDYGPFAKSNNIVNIDFAPDTGNHSVRAGKAHWNQLHTKADWPTRAWGKPFVAGGATHDTSLKNSRGEDSPVGVILIPSSKAHVLNAFSLDDPSRLYGDPLLDDYLCMKAEKGRRDIISSLVLTSLEKDKTYKLQVFSSSKTYPLYGVDDHHDTEIRIRHRNGASEGKNAPDEAKPIVFSGLRPLDHPQYGSAIIIDWGWIHNQTDKMPDWAILNGLILTEE